MNTLWYAPQEVAFPPTFPLLPNWLLDPGSLTAKLKAIHSDFKVAVLFQEQQVCFPQEREFLGIPKHEPTLVREVLLQSQGVPWVYARSILPLSALIKRNQGLATLGDNPLGEKLFSDINIQPGQIQVAEFKANSTAGQMNYQCHQRTCSLWGRRRLFHLQQGQILVAEVFLSPAPCYAQSV